MLRKLCEGCSMKQVSHCLIFQSRKRRFKKECPCQNCLLKANCSKCCDIRENYVKLKVGFNYISSLPFYSLSIRKKRRKVTKSR